MKAISQNPLTSSFVLAKALASFSYIKQFGLNLEFYSGRIQSATYRLRKTYEKGCELIDIFGNCAKEKKWQYYLEEVRNQSKHISYHLEIINLKASLKNLSNTQELWVNYDQHKQLLETSALKLEKLGSDSLIDNRRGFWNHEICIYKKIIAPEISRNEFAERFITKLLTEHDPKTIEYILEIFDEINFKSENQEEILLHIFQKVQNKFTQQPEIWQTIRESLLRDTCF